jgi:hypothetical protein
MPSIGGVQFFSAIAHTYQHVFVMSQARGKVNYKPCRWGNRESHWSIGALEIWYGPGGRDA